MVRGGFLFGVDGEVWGGKLEVWIMEGGGFILETGG